MGSLEKGLEFKSYEDLRRFLRVYEDKNFVQLCVYHARTISGSRKRGILRPIDDRLRYYEMIYRCIHSGKYTSRSTGKRQSNTYRQGCPFKIKLRVNLNGKTLDIVDFVDDHNHIHTKETYSLLPRSRHFDAPSNTLTRQLLTVQAKRKLLRIEVPTPKNTTVEQVSQPGSIESSESGKPATNGSERNQRKSTALAVNFNSTEQIISEVDFCHEVEVRSEETSESEQTSEPSSPAHEVAGKWKRTKVTSSAKEIIAAATEMLKAANAEEKTVASSFGEFVGLSLKAMPEHIQEEKMLKIHKLLLE